MVRIEREALIRPVWEQVDEPSLPDQVLGSEQKHLRDADDYWFHVYKPRAGDTIARGKML